MAQIEPVDMSRWSRWRQEMRDAADAMEAAAGKARGVDVAALADHVEGHVTTKFAGLETRLAADAALLRELGDAMQAKEQAPPDGYQTPSHLDTAVLVQREQQWSLPPGSLTGEPLWHPLPPSELEFPTVADAVAWLQSDQGVAGATIRVRENGGAFVTLGDRDQNVGTPIPVDPPPDDPRGG